MAYARLSNAQTTTIRLARDHAAKGDRRDVKKEIFASAKANYGIPADHKLTVEMDASVDGYALLRNSDSRELYTLDPNTGMWIGAGQPVRPTVPTRWFKVPASALIAALKGALEEAVTTGALDSADSLPDGVNAITNGALDVALDNDGNAYVLLAEDFLD